MAHSRAERRWNRYVKGMRRLKQDKQEHQPYGQKTLEEVCECFGTPGTKAYGKLFARFADHPKVCGGYCCGNPRRYDPAAETMQEKRAPQVDEEW